MLKCKIENDLYLESDGYGFALRRRWISKNGKPQMRSVGHYGSLGGAVAGALRQKIMRSASADLQTLLKEIEGHADFIQAQLRGA